MNCPCGNKIDYSECCEPFILGKNSAPTAEALMRSRYTAHVKLAMTYLRETLAPEHRKEFKEAEVKEWAAASEWKGLKILSVKGGQLADQKGTVEFTAEYAVKGKVLEHHETAEFRKDPKTNIWCFVDGDSHTHEQGKGHHHHEPIAPIVRQGPKVGRNDPCPCGSGKKFKKCCGA